MVAWSLSLGFALGLLALVSLGLSPVSSAEAAHPGWAPYAVAAKRPQFRPLHQHEPATAMAASRVGRASGRRWPAAAPSIRRGAPPSSYPLARAGSRKAVAVTRGQDLGLRFRPDERDPADGRTVPGRGAGPAAGGAELHSQFRPMPSRRRPTYEELEAGAAQPPQPMAPVMPYPMMVPPPLPGYGGYWRGW